MSEPWSTTIAVLGASEADEAHEVLAAALVSPIETISRTAALALGGRPGLRGQLEVLNQLPRLSTTVLQALRSKSELFDGALRQALLQGSPEQRQIGLTAVQWLHATDQIPQLIQLLRRTDLPDVTPVAETLRIIVSQLDDDSRALSLNDSARSRVTARRDQVLRDLDRAIDEFDSLTAKDDVVESILILGSYHHPVVRKILWQSTADCRDRAGNLLLTSRHPNLMQHALDALRETYPHPKAFEAVRERSDPEFLCELCRTYSQRSNAALEQNLKQIDRLSWLETPELPLALVLPSLQPALLAFVFATKIAKERKLEVQEWLLRNGGPAGRMAAAERAGQQSDGVLQEVLMDSLDSEDEGVQVWAVSQLRQHAVPETFSLLLKRLNSPSAEVRQAVREELSDFNTERVLELAESLDATTAQRVGALLLQIDEHALAKLQQELQSFVRSRRIHAARAIVKLGLHHELQQPLLALAADDDIHVRRTAAEIFMAIREPEAASALETLANDPQPRVREAAQAALFAWRQQSEQELDPLLADSIGGY